MRKGFLLSARAGRAETARSTAPDAVGLTPIVSPQQLSEQVPLPSHATEQAFEHTEAFEETPIWLQNGSPFLAWLLFR